MKATHIISTIIICMLAACTTRHDPRVEAAFLLADSAPEAAIDSIASLDSLVLPSTDRMLLRLAAIKAADKADIPLPGDTAILPLVDYYSSHETDRFYPTALYYAGRIYSESGDYPTALSYFQDALDILPENTPQLKLRGCVLSQTASLLGCLRMTDRAIEYYRAALKNDSMINDTLNMVYDMESLTGSLIYAHKVQEAIQPLLNAINQAYLQCPEEVPLLLSYKAKILQLSGNIDSATAIIRNLPKDNTICKDKGEILATATAIYQQAQLYDSVFVFAKELVELHDSPSKRMGYYYLLHDNIRHLSNADSINAYFKKYLIETENHFSKFGNENTIIQDTYYNYTLHERKRLQAEKSKASMIVIALVLAVLVCMLVIVAIYYKYRSQLRKAKLNEALENIKKLKEQIAGQTEQTQQEHEEPEGSNENIEVCQPHELKEALCKQIITAAQLTASTYIIPDNILSSPEYSELKKLLTRRKKINDSKYWRNLEIVVNGSFPEFSNNLTMLAGGKPRLDDLRTILLIKCGCTPSELGILLGLSKGAISSRRTEISKRIFGGKYNLKTIDAAIRLL